MEFHILENVDDELSISNAGGGLEGGANPAGDRPGGREENNGNIPLSPLPN